MRVVFVNMTENRVDVCTGMTDCSLCNRRSSRKSPELVKPTIRTKPYCAAVFGLRGKWNFAETNIGCMLAMIGEETVPYRIAAIALEHIVSHCSEHLSREIQVLLSKHSKRGNTQHVG